MKRLCVILIVASLLFLGCATTYKPIPPRAMTEKDSVVISMPATGKEKVKPTLAEIKGKIEYFHKDDQSFSDILRRAEKLDTLFGTRAAERRNGIKTQGIIGAVIGPVIVASTAGSFDSDDDMAALGAFMNWVILLPVQILGGYLTGTLFGELTASNYQSEEHMAVLRVLVNDYNKETIKKRTRQSQTDSIKTDTR